MHTNKTALAIMVVLGIILTSCYWKNWDTINNSGSGGSSSSATCSVASDSILYNAVMVFRPATSAIDTSTKISYSIDIAPIITSNCATSGACHSLGGVGAPAGPNGNTDFTFYGGHHSGLDQVCSGDTSGSSVWSCITLGTPYVMPPVGNAKLTACQMKKLKNWIHQGAQNN